MLAGLGDFGDDQAGEEPREHGIGQIYRRVGAGEAPPIPIGKIDDDAGGEAHPCEKRDPARITQS